MPASEGADSGNTEAGELAYHMAYLQRYADKLYFAGAASNWELTSFYLHEIEETAEAVIAEQHVEDGVNLGPLVDEMLFPAVERVEAVAEAGEAAAFAEAYGTLVTACNACHSASGHGFVRITVPERSGYPNQDYTMEVE